MSGSVTGLDRAVMYVQKLEEFRILFEKCLTNGDTAGVDTGRKFDRIYVQTWHNGQPNQRLARYFVDRNSWTIYACKSWSQYNPRREFGSLDTVDQYDWRPYYGTPLPGTPAETAHNAREAKIVAQFKPRGRPRKNPVKP